jgi:hypothetical protein
VLVGGWDYSTRAVDLVLVDIDGERPPWWHRFDLYGPDAWERTRTVARSLPGPSSQLWDEVIAFGLEEPRGQNAGVLYRVQGAILAALPPRVLVYPMVPSEWRKAVGLPGNATKNEVRDRVLSEWGPIAPLVVYQLPQDACDAYCVALATARLLDQQEAA